MAFTSTIASYPSRGPWGNGGWRGNCSGYLVKDLIESFSPTLVLDPMEGSGTSQDVCHTLGTPYLGYDLKNGDDILSHKTQWKIVDEVSAVTDGKGADLIFLHPPYWSMIRYSENPNDFSNGTYAQYLNRMRLTLKFLRMVLSENGRIALLLADLRTRNSGRTYFLTDDITEADKLLLLALHKELRIIKVQHNTVSNGVNNTGIPFAHEYLTILRKGRQLLGTVEMGDELEQINDEE